MHDNSEISINSAKALMEHSKKKANDAAAANKISQLVSEQVALQKESNELVTKALNETNLKSVKERALHESKSTDAVDVKPNFFGVGVNLNEVWRRFKKWRSKQNT